MPLELVFESHGGLGDPLSKLKIEIFLPLLLHAHSGLDAFQNLRRAEALRRQLVIAKGIGGGDTAAVPPGRFDSATDRFAKPVQDVVEYDQTQLFFLQLFGDGDDSDVGP